jgi:hypothetical protein
MSTGRNPVLQDCDKQLEKLREQLAFIENAGYREPAHGQWRPQFMFEDSPTCLNRDSRQPRKPCSECALIDFVPDGFAKKSVPCRYIPLNEHGETVDSFYRTGTQEELDTAVVKWLKSTIEQIEREKEQTLGNRGSPKCAR